MRFDVEEMVREWLVSGRKRGDFAARVSEFVECDNIVSSFSGRWYIYCAHHSDCPEPRGATVAPGICVTSPTHWRDDDGIYGLA